MTTQSKPKKGIKAERSREINSRDKNNNNYLSNNDPEIEKKEKMKKKIRDKQRMEMQAR